MSGSRGPVPKRDDERIRRNLDPMGPVDKITVIGAVIAPELELGEVHPLVSDLYASMQTSAQSKFFEDSDWQIARLAMHELNRHLTGPKPSAVFLQVLSSMLSSLLVTEGDRRRVRLEIDRNQNDGQQAAVISIADRFRERLGAN